MLTDGNSDIVFFIFKPSQVREILGILGKQQLKLRKFVYTVNMVIQGNSGNAKYKAIQNKI